jgi:hypothetical protein
VSTSGLLSRPTQFSLLIVRFCIDTSTPQAFAAAMRRDAPFSRRCVLANKGSRSQLCDFSENCKNGDEAAMAQVFAQKMNAS